MESPGVWIDHRQKTPLQLGDLAAASDDLAVGRLEHVSAVTDVLTELRHQALNWQASTTRLSLLSLIAAKLQRQTWLGEVGRLTFNFSSTPSTMAGRAPAAQHGNSRCPEASAGSPGRATG